MCMKPLINKGTKDPGKGNEDEPIERFSHTKKKGKHKRAKTTNKTG